MAQHSKGIHTPDPKPFSYVDAFVDLGNRDPDTKGAHIPSKVRELCAQRIQRTRKHAKLSQTDLARKVGTHKNTISRMEITGRGWDRYPSAYMLMLLAQELRVNPAWLSGCAPKGVRDLWPWGEKK